MSYVPRLKEKYKKEVAIALMQQFQYKTVMQVPKIVKISLNQGIGGATGDKKLVDSSLNELSTIAGQKAVSTKARKAISNFNRLITIALPRVRDFRGINDKSFDGRGNYTFGVTEHIIFPEIDIDKVSKITGMDITIVTTAKTDAEALALLKAMGLPFKKPVVSTPVVAAAPAN
jgi:large subunit ribosomal protein L5